MKNQKRWNVSVDAEGRLVLPDEAARSFGFIPGSQAWLETSQTRLELRPPVTHLAKLYIEPTNICNLDCRTCMRNGWDEPLGSMSMDVFDCLLAGLKVFDPLPTVFFGGFGEPLSHPHILTMLEAVKKLGAPVEMITNGILLNAHLAGALIDLEINRIWVSLDGASPESYADVRLGAALPEVLANLQELRLQRLRRHARQPHLGIAFVAMQRNIADLPEVIRLGTRLGATRFSISNLLPHTPELRQEILYQRSMYNSAYQSPGVLPQVTLPRMDLNDASLQAILEVLRGDHRVSWNSSDEGRKVNVCPFVEQNSTSIRWDGQMSPCLPLLHSYESYLDDRSRRSKAFTVGNLQEHSLMELWNDPAYTALRTRLVEFGFSPCTFCNSCEMPEQNLEDCFGNLFPTCGGCLWSQGFIACP